MGQSPIKTAAYFWWHCWLLWSRWSVCGRGNAGHHWTSQWL